MRYLINRKTSRIFPYTELLYKNRESLDLVECDEKGKIIEPSAPDSDLLNPLRALRLLEETGIFERMNIDVRVVEKELVGNKTPPQEFAHLETYEDDEEEVHGGADDDNKITVLKEAVERIMSGKVLNIKNIDRNKWLTKDGVPKVWVLVKESGIEEINSAERDAACNVS